MRKSIILTVVAITALAIAGLGGVFADYSDIETSHGNYLETGSLDLKVSYAGLEWEDPLVPVLVNASNIMPECYDKSFHFDLHNVGNYSQGSGWAYIHIKNVVCSDTGSKTEPERAAELGTTPIGEDKDGNPVYANPPLGRNFGENCTLSHWIDFALRVGPGKNGPWTSVNLSALDENGDGNIKLNEVECTEIFLGDMTAYGLGNLGSGVTLYVVVDLMLEDIPEEALGYDLFDESIPSEAKWNCWPTNALQDDIVTFDIACELFQFPKGLFVPLPGD
jgi:hypothetical protein